ncbi:MAG: glycosyltransferase family 4 protein [Candidatus Pacearchaeota archaeon]
MRIAILEPYIEGIGGAQRVIAKYSNYLKEKGHYVEIFTQRYDPKTAYAEFKNIKITILKLKNKIFSPFVYLLKKFRGFDLIIANDWPTHFASLRNDNVVWICYSPKRDFYDLKKYYLKNYPFYEKMLILIKNILFKSIDILSAKKAKKIMPISKNVLDRVKKYYNREGEIFYCGIDFDRYYNKKYGNYILCISRLVKPKRVDILIRSMGLVKSKIKLLIAGDGPEMNNLKKLAKNYPNVKLLGAVDEKKLIELYANCLAVVYVPIDEDWGLIPLEAGASGKLTIGVNEGGLKETIINNKTGFLINNITPEKIAEKIDYLAKNKKIAIKMGNEARKIARKFDWKILLKSKNLYNAVFNKQNGIYQRI